MTALAIVLIGAGAIVAWCGVVNVDPRHVVIDVFTGQPVTRPAPGQEPGGGDPGGGGGIGGH
jgi:hypothetical protein